MPRLPVLIVPITSYTPFGYFVLVLKVVSWMNEVANCANVMGGNDPDIY